MSRLTSSSLLVGFDTTIRRENGVEYFEHHVGDFATPSNRNAIEMRFTGVDAAALAKMVTRITGDVRHAIIALYPYVRDPWRALSKDGWTTLHQAVFRRRSVLGLASRNLWVVGYAHAEEKLADMLYWAWTLPGRDTLMIVHAAPDQANALVESFEDDHEDGDAMDVKLIPIYPTIVSRAVAGRHVRVSSKAVDHERLQMICDEIRQG